LDWRFGLGIGADHLAGDFDHRLGELSGSGGRIGEQFMLDAVQAAAERFDDLMIFHYSNLCHIGHHPNWL
jgi:hypothetical protein